MPALVSTVMALATLGLCAGLALPVMAEPTKLCAELHQDESAAVIGAALARCDGRRVRVFGPASPPGEPQTGADAMPPMLLQHPILTVPALAGPDHHAAGPQADSHQSYLDLGALQLIVLSPGPLGCAPPLWIEGRLESIDLGGPRTTKQGYRGWAVHVRAHACP